MQGAEREGPGGGIKKIHPGKKKSMFTAKPPTDDSGKRTVFLCKSVGASACGVALATATGANVVYARTVADGTVYAMQHPGTRHATIDKALARVEGVAFADGLSDIGSGKVASYGADVETKRGCALYGLIYNVEKRCGNGFATHDEVAQCTKDGVVRPEAVVEAKKREREEPATGDDRASKDEVRWLLSQKRMYMRGTLTRWFCSTCRMHGSLKKLAACECRRILPVIGCHCGFEGDLRTEMEEIEKHAYEVCDFIKETTFEVEVDPDDRMVNAVVQRAKGGWLERAREIMARKGVATDDRLLSFAEAWTYALPTPPWPFAHLGPSPAKWERRTLKRVPANLGALWQQLGAYDAST